MVTLPDTIMIVAGLLVLISVLQPIARRFSLPNAVLLAFVGVVISLAATYLTQSGQQSGIDAMAERLLGVPITSAGFIYIFLPILLFQSALEIDMRRMIDDAAAIFLMAVVAVLASTALIGLSVWWVAGVSLIACLLFGALVATTDPAAVVAIFRDLGAPARLTRLVEGESLLNDATAIVLYTVLLSILTTGVEPSLLDAGMMFVKSLFGGAIVGLIGARLAMSAIPLLRGSQAAELTLTIGLPYLLFVIGEYYLGVSGVVAVVVGGIVVGTVGRNRLSPKSWQLLSVIWEQIAFLAGSLVFLLAALVVPHLLIGSSLQDIFLILVAVIAAFVARAIVLFGLLPLLSPLGLGERVSTPYKLVILWGGLRGAVTLALALSITENPHLSEEVQRFVAVLATGFVLFSLLVGGTTLRPLIRLMQIDRLSPLDQAMRRQILSLSLDSVRDTAVETAQRYGFANSMVTDSLKVYRRHVEDVTGDEDPEDAIPDRNRVTIGLVALVNRERQLISEHAGSGALSLRLTERLLANTEEAADATRTDGRLGYNRTAQKRLRFSRLFRIGHFLHRRFGIDGLLERCVADRFEMLMVSRIVLEELQRYDASKLKYVLGGRLSGILGEILTLRMEATTSALDALRLQYPEYAEAIERRFLVQLAIRLESAEYDTLRDEELIGQELHGNLTRELQAVRVAVADRPHLDLGLNTDALIEKFPMFSDLDSAERRSVRKLLKPRLALPGEDLIRKGDAGASIFFISSGAVEVSTGAAKIRLGRGDFFGEMAVLTGRRRQADVSALSYCQLLVLEESDVRRLLASNPSIKERIDRVAQERRQMNLGETI